MPQLSSAQMHPSAQAIAPNNALLDQNRAAVCNLQFSVNQKLLRGGQNGSMNVYWPAWVGQHQEWGFAKRQQYEQSSAKNQHIRMPGIRRNPRWHFVFISNSSFISTLSNMHVKSSWSTKIWEQYARNSASRRRWFRRSLLKRTATKCAWKMTWWHVLQCTLPYGIEESPLYIFIHLPFKSWRPLAEDLEVPTPRDHHHSSWCSDTDNFGQEKLLWSYSATALLTRPLSSSSTSDFSHPSMNLLTLKKCPTMYNGIMLAIFWHLFL